MGVVLLRMLNARAIELHSGSKGETVGVLRRNGDYQYKPWLGFVTREAAKIMGKPVKLLICRTGETRGVHVEWEGVPEGKHVQGCLTGTGVHALEPVRLV